MPPETTGGIFGREETVMQINKQALQEIIPDSERLLFEENIPSEYLSDALGRRTGTADALVFALSTEEVSGVLRYANENGIPVTPRGVRKQMPSPGARSGAPSSVNVPPETPATRPTRSPTAFGVSNDATPARFPSKK